MSYAVKCEQARCAALGYWPGPIDGVLGPRTARARAAARQAQAAKHLPFQHPSGLTRLHLHWSAGVYTPNRLDLQHYHVLVDGEGNVHRPHPPETRLAHTLNANGGAIAVAVCAMAGAQERPFVRGSAPLNALQLAVMARVAAEFCRDYDIPVSRYSVLTHAEVQPTLGIRQRQKWDVCWLPGMPEPGDPITVGDRLRQMVSNAKAGLP